MVGPKFGHNSVRHYDAFLLQKTASFWAKTAFFQKNLRWGDATLQNLGGVMGLLYEGGGPKHPQKSHIPNVLGQRAENGGLDPSWLNLAFLGRPDFQSRGSKILVSKVFGTSGRKIGAPQKRQIQPRRIPPPILGPLIRRTQIR